ncbi:hypothetical protein [uncultured Methylibium sp.]|uniref:hypothetical protein n=1 Tax=uncultured Methylibium sp. TaxID=381093 RepID=UPI0025E539EB|nr:hypothetical protein [uncultured Methylibium sp.]
MSSIRFIAPTLALRRVPSALAAARARRAARDEREAQAAAPCCGWFDSSYELSQGLLVTEHRELDDPATLEMAVGMAIDTAFGDWLQ